MPGQNWKTGCVVRSVLEGQHAVTKGGPEGDFRA